jgi:ABC-type sulfate transport system substrate-binding protein
MPATMRIDTLKFVRKLTESGMDRRQAEAIVEGLSEADISELATRADVDAATTALRVEMREMKAEIFRAMLLQAGTIVGLTVALIKLLP